MARTRTIFAAGLLAGFALVFGLCAAYRPPAAAAVDAKPLAGGIWVSAQIGPRDFDALNRRHFKSIIDLRPDGEAADQLPSAQARALAEQRGLHFAYVPVPHGDIPDDAVYALSAALASAEPPTLLYCRSGRRAARTWALAEAARTGGLDAATIAAAVRSVGQGADDLDAPIAARIAARAAENR